MKSHARIVIIGGGVVGASALYHLTAMGETDCVLIELDELTSGSTWHAAGNVPTLHGARNLMKLQYYSTQLYARLADEVDYPMNYHINGSVRLAQTSQRMQEFRHHVSIANALGMEYEILSNNQLKDIYPYVELDNLQGALWDPYDGDIDPSQLTQALAKGARTKGAEINRFTRVIAITQQSNGEWLISTDKGEITCEIVINAGGYRGVEVAAMIGQYLPMVSLEHQYLVTEPIDALKGLDKRIPLLRDPDDSYYLRQEGEGLILGPYEKENAKAHWRDLDIPENFAYQLFEDDLDRLGNYIEAACARVPILAQGGVSRVINGPIPYAPDGNPYIGPAFGHKNFYHCCGFSFGICQGGGAGKAIAEWVLEGEPEWDFWSVDPRRYQSYANKKYAQEKAIELYQHEYAIGFPYEERPAGRPANTTPVYQRLKEKGAMFGARAGWERATWFPKGDDQRGDDLSFEHCHWHNRVGEECKAVQESVGIMDLGGFSKFEVTGANARTWLDSMIAGDLPNQGRISLSYCCTEKGGVLSEFTISRLADNHFYLISAAVAEFHDEDWLRQHLPEDGSVKLENVGRRYGTLIIAGPKARKLLEKVTEDDVSNAAFTWLSVKTIHIGLASILALRVNYVGELGWELHVPVEQQLDVYDALTHAGEEFAIVDFGIYAMESMRIEKCYRSWKGDLDHEYSPLRSGLDRFVNLNKPVNFIGKQAMQAEVAAGLKDVFVPFLVEKSNIEAGYGAPVSKDGEVVGMITSAGFGHRLNQSVALGYIRTDLAVESTQVEIDVYGEMRKATVTREPIYDPKNQALRA